MSTSRAVKAAVVLAVGTLVSSCQLFTGLACTQEARPGIRIDVRDSLTNAPANSGARAIAREGAYADTAEYLGPEDFAFFLAEEREGTYTVTVEKEGYQLWSRSGVRVTGDRCHVRTVSLTARLKR